MKRVNQFTFYQIGAAVHPLTQVREGVKTGDVWLNLLDTRGWLDTLLNDAIIPLGTCRTAARKLLEAVVAALPDPRLHGSDWDAALEEPLVGYWSIRRAAMDFETVLAAELELMATYFVSRKGLYSTNELIENAEQHFTPAVKAQIPAGAISDIQQSGRCLAFDLDTAAGFHIVRATETMIHRYYVAVTNATPRRKDRNWGAYVRNLNNHRRTVPGSQVDAKLVALIDQVREHHRNPVVHPEVVLSPDDAQSLFSVCTGVIIAFATAYVSLVAQPQTLPLPAPAAAVP